MPALQKKIASIINSEEKIPPSPLVFLLAAASTLYGTAQRIRAYCYRHKLRPVRELPCTVISVGNITAGGTGKTPLTIYLASKLQQDGIRVAVISRGYKGGAERAGGVVSNGEHLLMNSEQAGDEPFLIASRLKDIPVVVGKNRYDAGRMTINQFQPDVIVLDDAFQHLKLKRDIDLVLLDCARPFGNTHLLPRGALREPPGALARATACILTRSEASTKKAAAANHHEIKSLLPEVPVFASSHEPYVYPVKSGAQTHLHAIDRFLSPSELERINHYKVYGFSGIARNDHFRQTVEEIGFNTVGFSEFSDHHRYRGDDLARIIRAAQKDGADCLITTEKDYARITHQMPLPLDLIVVGVRVAFKDDGRDFMSFIRSRLKA